MGDYSYVGKHNYNLGIWGQVGGTHVNCLAIYPEFIHCFFSLYVSWAFTWKVTLIKLLCVLDEVPHLLGLCSPANSGPCTASHMLTTPLVLDYWLTTLLPMYMFVFFLDCKFHRQWPGLPVIILYPVPAYLGTDRLVSLTLVPMAVRIYGVATVRILNLQPFFH